MCYRFPSSAHDVITICHLTKLFRIQIITAQPCMRSLYNAVRPFLQPQRILPISLVALSISLARNYSINPFNAIMGGSSSASASESYPIQKSDEDWRAVLSPEQVIYFVSRLIDSSASSDRRVLRWQELGSMRNLRGKGYLIAAPVVRLSTRVHQSLIRGVDGLRLPKGSGSFFVKLMVVFLALLNVSRITRGV